MRTWFKVWSKIQIPKTILEIWAFPCTLVKLIEGKAEIVQQQNLLWVFVRFSVAEFAVLGDKLLNLYGFLLGIYSQGLLAEFAFLGDNLLNMNNCHTTKQ